MDTAAVAGQRREFSAWICHLLFKTDCPGTIMFEKIKDLHQYMVNDWNTGGWKIRMVARTHMLNAVICELLYTYWMFSLPRGWDPSMPAFGPFEGYGREFRIFCFFIYNMSLFINCGQFFNGLLLYGCVDRGIKDKEISLETAKFYNIFSGVFVVINTLKFALLYIYLRYDLLFCVLMTIPEILGLVLGMLIISYFRYELVKMDRVEDDTTYTIGKTGKIVFD